MIVVGLLHACGRVGFDPRGVAADAAPLVSPDAGCALGPWQAPLLLAELNSDSDDYGATVSSDGTFVVFASDRPASTAISNLWWSSRPSPASPWSPPAELAEINTDGYELSPSMTGDGLELVFGSNRGGGAWRLWHATRANRLTPFGPPRQLTELEDGLELYDPGISGDGLSLWFNAGPNLGVGEVQLSRRGDREAAWSPRAPITDDGGFHGSPLLSSDLRELYVMADRPGGLGGWDLWLDRRNDLDVPFSFGAPIAELGTVADDYASHLSADGRTLYLVQGGAYFLGDPDDELAVATRACAP